MHKYEYTFSIKSGFAPYGDYFVLPEKSITQNPDEIDVKEMLKNALAHIKQNKEVIFTLKDYLEKVLLQKSKKGGEKSLDLNDFDIKPKFANKYLVKHVSKVNEKIYFAKLQVGARDELLKILENTINTLDTYQKEIGEELEKPLPNHAKTREILRKLLRNPDIDFAGNRSISVVSFLEDLFTNTDYKEKSWQSFVSTGVYKNFALDLEANLTVLLPKKEVLKASLNKATVNKSYTPKEVKKKIEEIQNEMTADLSKCLKADKLSVLKEYFEKIKNTFPECSDKLFDPENISLQDAAEKLRKLYKNCIKKKFNKALENVYNTHKALNYDVVLASEEVRDSLQFILDQSNKKFKERFREYLQAKQAYLEIGKENKEEKENAVKHAGSMFTAALRRVASDFIQIKNTVAREYGQLRAKAKSLDNARFFLSHFALLAFEKGKEFDSENTYTIFIPKRLMKEGGLYKAFEQSQANPTHTVYELHSLTLSALKNKLIAKNASKLIPYLNTKCEGCSEEIAIYTMKLFMYHFFDLSDEYFLEPSGLNKKTISKIRKAFIKKENTIILPHNLREKIRHNVLFKEHKSVEEFRFDLENNFYYLQKRNINIDTYLSLLQNKLKEYKSWHNKENTLFAGKVQFGQVKNKRYVQEFAMLLKDIKEGRVNHSRLNPEITLFFTEKDPSKAKHEKSRFNKDRFTIQFNYSKNKPGALLDAKFSDDEELRQAYEAFNQNLKEKIKKAKKENRYIRVGIDVGTSDFVSVAFFNDWEKNRDIQKEGFPFKEVEVYKITNFDAKGYIENKNKPEGYTEVILWKNPSYFLNSNESKRAFKDKNLKERVNPDDYIEKIHTYAFDTSSAKVIGDKVVINADIANYLKLFFVPVVEKMIKDGKTVRSISNIPVNRGERRNNISLQFEGGYSLSTLKVADEILEMKDGILYDQSDGGILIEILENLTLKLKEFNEVEDKLEYLHTLEKRLKKTIAANIASSLYKIAENENCVPEFFVESEPEAFLTDHEMHRYGKRTQQAISREFIPAILKKLQKYEFVPPKINRQFMLRELKHLEDKVEEMQFGVVYFIPAARTSQLCPVCLYKKGESKKDKNASCLNCDFDNPKEGNKYGIHNDDIQAATVLANPNAIKFLRKLK